MNIFDATKQAEFLYKCIQETIENTIPAEVDYLEKYDLMKDYLDNYFDRSLIDSFSGTRKWATFPFIYLNLK